MSIVGSAVYDHNFRLRFFVIITLGILSTGSVLFWRSQLMLASEYQEMPTTHYQVKVRKENRQITNSHLKQIKQMETE